MSSASSSGGRRSSVRGVVPGDPRPTAYPRLVVAVAPRRLDLSDGVKAYDERGWVQVVPDEDEPLVQLYAEGETEELTAELAEEITVFVDSVVQGDAVEQRTLEQASS